MTKLCLQCEGEYLLTKDKPGPIYLCAECGTDPSPRYTGNIIYDHKTGADLQINSDPELTKYIIESTKLRNKGSNLGNNLKVDSTKAKSNGMQHGVSGRSRRRE